MRILGLGSRELAKTRRLCSENTNRSAKVVATHEFFFAFFALLIIIAKIATIVLFSFGKVEFKRRWSRGSIALYGPGIQPNHDPECPLRTVQARQGIAGTARAISSLA